MPITEAFTVSAAAATILNAWFLRRMWRQRQAQRAHEKQTGENGPIRRIAVTFVRVWSAILLADLLVLVAGIGILTGHRPFGYLLALMPLASSAVGLLALHGFE